MIKCYVSSPDIVFDGEPPQKFEKTLESPYCDLRGIYLAIKSLSENSKVIIYNDNETVIGYLKHRQDVKHKRVQRWIAAIWSECERKNLDVSFKFGL